MMGAHPVTTIDPALVGLVTAAITAAATFAVARVGKDTKTVEKSPDVQDQINKAVAGLITHYSHALQEEKARHADHVQELEDRLKRSEAHIDQLRAALKRAGIAIPAWD
jgi:biopolymer transport protein ExbB/TolQ